MQLLRFRWAVCQIDILRRLKTKREIRFALQDLPETLDETYERIFKCISLRERHIARTTLSMICGGFGEGYIHCDTLQPLILQSLGLDPFESGSSMVDEETIKDICGCLVTVDRHYNIMTLAHYTVQEFLYSKRLKKSDENLRYFALSCEFAQYTWLRIVLRIALRFTTMESMEHHEMLATRTLYEGFRYLLGDDTSVWVDSLRGQIRNLALEFLNEGNPHFSQLVEILGNTEYSNTSEARNGIEQTRMKVCQWGQNIGS